MKSTVVRILVLLFVVGATALRVASMPRTDVEIDQIFYVDDTNKALVIVLSIYGQASSISKFGITFTDSVSGVTAWSRIYEQTPFPFYADNSNTIHLNLHLDVPTLAAGSYVVQVDTYDLSGGDIPIATTTTNFDHTLAALAATATLPLPTETPAPVAVQPPDTPIFAVPGLLIVGVGVLIVVVVAGILLLGRRQSVMPAPAASTGSLPPETVFISYSRQDWDRYVEPLSRRLTRESIPFWLDQNLIQDGDDWLDAIGVALRDCQRLILCVSPEALNSQYVKMEYRYFYTRQKPIYPLVCRPSDLPAELSGIQYVDFDKLDKLIALLKAPLQRPPRVDAD